MEILGANAGKNAQFRWRLHDNATGQKQRFVVILPVRLHNNDENAHAKWRHLNPDQTGDLNNGYFKNANFSCVNTEKQIHNFDTDVP